MCHSMVQDEQEVRLHPHRLPGGLHESELALELRGQLISGMPWAPEVPHSALITQSPHSLTSIVTILAPLLN